MADVFLSYSRRNKEFVQRLYEFLTGTDKDVWVDWDDIPPASEWQQDIAQNIEGADGFVFVVSAHSLASAECAKELEHALGRGKRIVPIACEQADPGAAREELRKLNWIWCVDDDGQGAAFDAVLKGLDTDLAWVHAHTRVLVRAVEWDENERNSSFLLRGTDLKEAEQQVAAGASKDPPPTELQSTYVVASRHAATRRQRMLLGGVSLALIVAIGLGVLSLLQRNDARAATQKATSVALASGADDHVGDTHPDQALLLALAAYGSSATAQARSAVLAALENAQQLGVSEFLHGDSPVTSFSFSPDGSELIVGSADGSVRLWNVRKHEELATLAAQSTAPVVSVGSGAGGLVMAASSNGVIRFWHGAAAHEDPEFRAPGKLVAAAVSADGHLVAAIGGGRHVWLWNRRTGTRYQLPAPAGGAVTLAFSHDGRTLAAAFTHTFQSDANALPEQLGAVAVYDTTRRKLLGLLPNGKLWVTGLAFAPRGDVLATAGANTKFEPEQTSGAVRIWNARRLQQLGRVVKSKQNVDTVAFLPGGKVIAGRNDGSLQVASPLTGKWIGWTRSPLDGSASLLAVSSDGRTFAAAATPTDTSVRLGPIRQRLALGRVAESGSNDFDGIAFSPDGRTLAVTKAGLGPVKLVNVRTGVVRTPRWLRAFRSADQAAFSPDGRLLAITNFNSGEVLLWNLQTHKRVGRLFAPPGAEGADALAFNASGSELAVSYLSNAVRLWDVPQRKLIGHAVDPNAFGLMFSGSTVFMISDNWWVESWDGHSTPRRVFTPPASAQVASTTLGNNDWLWKLVAELRHSGGGAIPVTGNVTLSPDGKTLAIAENSSAGGVQLWDVATRTPIGPLLSSPAGPNIVFSLDGTSLAAAFDAGPVQIWRGLLWRNSADLKTRVCELVVGGFSAGEWSALEPGFARPNPCG